MNKPISLPLYIMKYAKELHYSPFFCNPPPYVLVKYFTYRYLSYYLPVDDNCSSHTYIQEVFIMTMTLKRSFFAFTGLLLALVVLSSCGTQPTTGSTSSPAQPAATSAPAISSSSNSNDYGTGSTASTPTASTSTSTDVVIKTAMVTVGGKSTTVLTDAKGMTLYYFTPDTASKVACTDSCAQTWPPLLFANGNSPKADGTLPGELEVYPDANGKQVIYNDHELYTFSGDSAPGQTNGQGIAGKWFVVTPDVAKNKA
jgi:predicted lipoprotein with Yx(FWY)xxD motif